MGNNKNNYTLSSFMFEKCNEHAYLCVKEILRKQKNVRKLLTFKF